MSEQEYLCKCCRKTLIEINEPLQNEDESIKLGMLAFTFFFLGTLPLIFLVF